MNQIFSGARERNGRASSSAPYSSVHGFDGLDTTGSITPKNDYALKSSAPLEINKKSQKSHDGMDYAHLDESEASMEWNGLSTPGYDVCAIDLESSSTHFVDSYGMMTSYRASSPSIQSHMIIVYSPFSENNYEHQLPPRRGELR